MDSWRGEAIEQASKQFGLVTTFQAVGYGGRRRQVQRLFERPEWQHVEGALWRVAGSADSLQQRLMAKVLLAGPGSVLSNESAASLFGVPGYEAEDPVHVSRGRTNSTTPSGTVVHRVRKMAPEEVTVLDGLPVVRPFLIPFQLADAGVPLGRLARLVDRLWSDRLLTGAQLHRHYEERFCLGHQGRRMMRSLLDERGPLWVPPASGLEGRVMTTLERYSLFGFERQVDLGDNLAWIGRVDFVHRRSKLIIEVQSDRHHTAVTDQQADAKRRAALEAAGFTVIEVWESEVWHKPDLWTARVRSSVAPT